MNATRLGLGPPAPWTRAAAIRTALLVVLGCAVWAIGWYRVADEGAFDSQIAPFNLAVLGLALVCASYVLWFVGGRRAVDTRRRVLLGDDARLTAREATEAGVGPDLFVGAERLYHRPECPMTQGRSWVATSRADQLEAGREPCGWCEP
ncbi:hypothetical protein [Sporichthya polymorpha]|uniref:hypothetical protein n=1 Tax=Sporichthya polymorpha TaxID=35751 RepID=UPI0003633A94|nr:hypothetical protein [Sporichthya polymorpha]